MDPCRISHFVGRASVRSAQALRTPALFERERLADHPLPSVFNTGRWRCDPCIAPATLDDVLSSFLEQHVHILNLQWAEFLVRPIQTHEQPTKRDIHLTVISRISDRAASFRILF